MQDLFKPGEISRTETRHVGTIVTEDEPAAAVNAGISWAIVLTIVLSVFTFFGGLLALSIAPYSDQKATVPQVQYFKQSATDITKTQQQGNVSYSGGQAVQSDAIMDSISNKH